MFSDLFYSYGKSFGNSHNSSLLSSSLGFLGATIGSAFDNMLVGHHRMQIGARLDDLTVQTSTYGKFIPQIFGTIRLRGNIIWSDLMSEEFHQFKDRAPKGKKITYKDFTYRISVAIAICAGKIDNIKKIWLDDLEIEPSKYKYRIYHGDENQSPDPTIEACLGRGKSPAFRGLSYIVFEDLNLQEFNNRLPQFVFEVERFSQKCSTSAPQTSDSKNHDEVARQKVCLSAIVQSICQQCGLSDEILDIKSPAPISGFAISSMQSGRQLLENFTHIYDIELIEKNGILAFCQPSTESSGPHLIDSDDLLPVNHHYGNKIDISFTQAESFNLPTLLNISYLSEEHDFKLANCFAYYDNKQQGQNHQQKCLDLPLVLEDKHAKQIANNILFNLWQDRQSYTICLPITYHHLNPGDVISFYHNERRLEVAIKLKQVGNNGMIVLHAAS